jgi:cysteinyl-tRNA synthetase
MGHARYDGILLTRFHDVDGGWCRNYVTQDILRRIMTDYFGYDVQLVMNITDIDDKVPLAHTASPRDVC